VAQHSPLLVAHGPSRDNAEVQVESFKKYKIEMIFILF
jgi:hypothetical protein